MSFYKQNKKEKGGGGGGGGGRLPEHVKSSKLFFPSAS